MTITTENTTDFASIASSSANDKKKSDDDAYENINVDFIKDGDHKKDDIINQVVDDENDFMENTDIDNDNKVDNEVVQHGGSNNNGISNDDTSKKCKFKCECSAKKITVGVILLGLIVFVIVDSLTNQYVKNGIVSFLVWIESNPILGMLGFICIYFFATIFFVPGAILTLGAGFVFTAALDSLGYGVLLASIAVFIGASLGSIASFLLGRYLLRDGFVSNLTERYPVFEAIDKALEDKGLRIMILLRLSPIVPFNVLNYVSGITAIRFIHYCIALIGMIPGTVLYVFLGASAGSLSEIGAGDDDNENEEEVVAEEEAENKTVTIVVIVVGVVFGILAVAITSYYAKQELNAVIEKKEQETLALQQDQEEQEQQEGGIENTEDKGINKDDVEKDKWIDNESNV